VDVANLMTVVKMGAAIAAVQNAQSQTADQIANAVIIVNALITANVKNQKIVAKMDVANDTRRIFQLKEKYK
jgi:hypothetical protein